MVLGHRGGRAVLARLKTCVGPPRLVCVLRATHHRFPVDRRRSRAQDRERRSDAWKPLGPVMPAAREQPGPAAVQAGDEAIAVMLDLVCSQPGGRDVGSGRAVRLYEAGRQCAGA